MGRRNLISLLAVAAALAAAATATAAIGWRTVGDGTATGPPLTEAKGYIATSRGSALAQFGSRLTAAARAKLGKVDFARPGARRRVRRVRLQRRERRHHGDRRGAGSTLTVDLVPRPPAPGTVTCQALFPTYRFLAVPRSALGILASDGCRRRRCLSRSGSSGSRTDRVVFLDQRKLPLEEVDVSCRSAAEVADAIRTMVVRGAPAIGIAAAYGIALAAAHGEDLDAADAVLRASRPTAVNLAWALDEMRADPSAEHARAIHRDEVERCRRMAAHAAGLLRPGHAGADPLQRRRPRDRRLRQRGRGAARRLGARPAHARVGRRDPPAPPGRAPHGLGARDGRYTARRDRGLGGGIAHGGRRGRRRLHGRRPDRARTATPRTRSAPTGSPCSPPTTASRSTSSRRAPPSTTRSRAARRSRSRSATRRRSRRASRRATRPSTSRRRRSITAIVTEHGVHEPPVRRARSRRRWWRA